MVRLFSILALVGSAALGLAQVPFATNLRTYTNGNMWEYAYTSLSNGVTLYGRTILKSAGGAGRFDCELWDKDRAGAWRKYRTHRISQASGGSLYSGDTANPSKLLLEGIWSRSTAFSHFPNGMFLNPRIIMRNVGQQQVSAAGRTWNCNVYRRDEPNGYLLCWFNTRTGNVIKHEAYLNTSSFPFFRALLNATNAN